jgi:uncharacterized Zn finger protein
LILVYLDALKNKTAVSTASQDDPRLLVLGSTAYEEDSYDLETYDIEAEAPHDTIPDRLEKERETKPLRHPSSRKTREPKDDLRNIINEKTKGQLIQLIMKLSVEYPQIRQDILEEQQLKDGRIEKAVQSIRAEIARLSSEPGWSSHWSDDGYIPDYSKVRNRLERLLVSGHADQVVSLGDELWEKGIEQVGMSNDEGETGSEIAGCMEIVFRAVSGSSCSPADQILWMVEKFLEDDYGLLDRLHGAPDEAHYGKSEWSTVADSLLMRLSKLAKPSKKDDYSAVFERENIMNWAIRALEMSGRGKEVIPLLESEAPITHCYGMLIDYLLGARRKNEARRVAVKAFADTIRHSPGTAWSLVNQLRSMAEKEKNLPLVASYRALEFFDRPSLEKYSALENAARSVGEWPVVRDYVLRYLETGVRPDEAVRKSEKKNHAGAVNPWPFPSTDIATALETPSRKEFPDTGTLLQIAIHEKRPDEVLRWYEARKKAKFLGSSLDESVAAAVQKSYPDVALEIWQKLAENQINLVKPAAYYVAATYLRKMKKLYTANGRVPEWEACVGAIRAKHKAKRTLMEVLDGLEGKRILDT